MCVCVLSCTSGESEVFKRQYLRKLRKNWFVVTLLVCYLNSGYCITFPTLHQYLTTPSNNSCVWALTLTYTDRHYRQIDRHTCSLIYILACLDTITYFSISIYLHIHCICAYLQYGFIYIHPYTLMHPCVSMHNHTCT